jgi:hypothetical protein
MMNTMIKREYHPITSGSIFPAIKLVHPLSKDFLVYGDKDTVARAKSWALGFRYYLLDNDGICAHALYRMHCPDFGQCLPEADHTQVWVPSPDFSCFERFSGAESPFILTHPYKGALGSQDADDNGIPLSVRAYAAAHCLEAQSLVFDEWYSPGHELAIRLTPKSKMHTCPLEV